MIEKQITILIPKSQEEQFNAILEGFKEFTFDQYNQESHLNQVVPCEILQIQLSSTKFLNNLQPRI